LPPGPQVTGEEFFLIGIPGDVVPWWLIFFRKKCAIKNEMDNPDGLILTVLLLCNR
jgi:hypothetical protein